MVIDPALQAKSASVCTGGSTMTTQHSVLGVILFSVAMLLFFGGINAFLTYSLRFVAVYIAQNLGARLRSQLFDHMQRLSLDWHGKQKKGDLVQRVTGNSTDIEKLVLDGLLDLLTSMLTLTGVAIIMWAISPAYTLLSILIAPPLFIIVLVYTRVIKKASKRASKTAGQVADIATEDMNALTVIKVFTREDREGLRFSSYVDKNRQAALLAGRLQAQFTPIVSILVMIGMAIVIGIGGYVAAGYSITLGPLNIDKNSGVDIGTLILFLTYLKMLYQPMRDLSKLTNVATAAASAAERIQEVLNEAPEIGEVSGTYQGPRQLRGEITFKGVQFGYTPERTILKGIDLQIGAGKRVALVGLSGGGKTTLVKLIPRFYEIQQGTLQIDGVDNRMYPLNVLRQNVSMVLQDSVLFEGTLRENIEVGRPGASMDEIIEAAKKAHIHDSIINILGGYDRMVREQGKDLSGGQRQRIAIARAILRDAPILILDEPTAALDVEAEAEVMRALDTLIVGRTVLLISHRLSTLGHVDEIIVLKEGLIIEQGTYKELKQRGGVFASMLEEQNRYNLDHLQELSSPYAPTDQLTARPIAIAYGPVEMAASLPLREKRGRKQNRRHAMKMPRIIVELDGQVLIEQPLNKPVLTIGRLASNDVQIPNQRVSRLHAKLHQEDGNWVLEDADSVNGLVYQGNRVERVKLSNGDRVFVAPTAVLRYMTEG
jgi:ABC-type multidrug transport system fused ATPase/permease subunit